MSLDSFDGQFARRAAKSIADAIEAEKDAFANGFVKTLEDLQKRTGKIAGLRAALDLMKQAENDLREG